MKVNNIRILALLISIIVLCTSQSVPTQAQSVSTTQTQKLYPVSKSGQFSYVDINGNEVLKTDYGYADDYIDGVAHVSKEFGGEKLYIDTKGNLVNYDGKGYSDSNFRVIKDGKFVDLSSKVKEYTTKDEENFTVSVEEYDIGDGFIFKETRAGGAPQRRLFKNGKVFFTTSKWVSNRDIMTIVKYDDEKMIRFSYIDYLDDCKFKTTYIDYDGNQLFTKSSKKEVKVIFNGETLSLKNAAVIEGKIVLLPADELLQKLGYKVNWNTKTKKLKATKKSSVVSLSANSKKASINNKTVTMEVKAKVINKVLFISPKKLSNKLSITYSWDANTNTITIEAKNKTESSKPETNSKTTGNGIQVINKLSESNPVLNVFIELGDDLNKREKEAADIIIKALEEAGGANFSDDQKKQVTSYILSDIGKVPEEKPIIKVKDTEYVLSIHDNAPYRQVYINTYIRN